MTRINADATESLIRRYLAAFNAGDSQGMLDCLSDDVIHDINEGGQEVGKDRFREFNSTMSRHYREQLHEIVVLTNNEGTRAAAEFVVEGTYLESADGLPNASGQRYNLPAGIFFEISEGLISRVTTYYNLADWVSQVTENSS